MAFGPAQGPGRSSSNGGKSFGVKRPPPFQSKGNAANVATMHSRPQGGGKLPSMGHTGSPPKGSAC